MPLPTVPDFSHRPPMPIRPHLDGHKFDSETIRVMGLAFEMALVALRLADRGDLANEVLARRIMDLAKAGERNPERLCEGVLHEFRGPPPQVCWTRQPRRCDGETSPERAEPRRCQPSFGDASFWASHLVPRQDELPYRTTRCMNAGSL